MAVTQLRPNDTRQQKSTVGHNSLERWPILFPFPSQPNPQTTRGGAQCPVLPHLCRNGGTCVSLLKGVSGKGKLTLQPLPLDRDGCALLRLHLFPPSPGETFLRQQSTERYGQESALLLGAFLFSGKQLHTPALQIKVLEPMQVVDPRPSGPCLGSGHARLCARHFTPASKRTNPQFPPTDGMETTIVARLSWLLCTVHERLLSNGSTLWKCFGHFENSHSFQ